MISVVIPALNEEKTIGNVVRFAFQSKGVTEVIVIDDASVDNTKRFALEAGAKVIDSTRLGKGISMKEGIIAASNNCIVFLDGDIDPYPAQTISLLTEPVLNEGFELVKASFSRNAGRVTELVAKPLLQIFYPELSVFSQPLSGMIAGSKKFLQKLHLVSDYGVDIGILIDAHLMHARMKEVNIGYIENKSKPWHMLGKMSGEVAKAIINKAILRKGHLVTLDELQTIHVISESLEDVLMNNQFSLKKLAAFDMDDTILQGRFIDHCAKRFGFENELKQLRESPIEPTTRTKQIAMLLKGRSITDLLAIVQEIPMIDDIVSVVKELKSKGYIVGIISDSYQFITNYVKSHIGADFALANNLEQIEGKATGEVNIPSYFYYQEGDNPKPGFSKANALNYICHEYNIPLANTIAIGDSANDIDMVEVAGMGVAFNSKEKLLIEIADYHITEKSFQKLLKYA